MYKRQLWSGNIKSSIGMGIILYEGIGDTIRVSLTGDPEEEVRTAKLLLRTLGLRKGGIEVVSCPTCLLYTSKAGCGKTAHMAAEGAFLDRGMPLSAFNYS